MPPLRPDAPTDGLVINGGVDEVTGRGRRSTHLDVPGTAGHAVGVSFGAHTTCVLVTDLRGRELKHVIVRTWTRTRPEAQPNGWSS
jgi:hypothetical protein